MITDNGNRIRDKLEIKIHTICVKDSTCNI